VQITDFVKNNKSKEAVKIAEEIRNIHTQVSNDLNLSKVVFDYIDKIINELCQIIYAVNVIGEITNKTRDMIYSIGEVLSSYIISEYAATVLKNVKHIDSRKIIATNNNFTEAEVDFVQTEKLIKNKFKDIISDNSVFICGGFIAADLNGNTTTLGRGGSDYSAAVIAKSIKSDRLEIWTDVDGILSSDPRLIKNAMLLKEISYIEAAELAYFGAKVLHPKTIYPAIEANIPVYVLNSFKPDGIGTLVAGNSKYSNMIKAIAFRRNITVINITSNRMLGAYGFLAKVFDVFLKNETSVDLVTTSEVSISLSIDNVKNLERIKDELSEFANIDILKERAIISVVGEGIRDTSGIASRFFGAISGINISMISMGASEVNLSIIVLEDELEKAVRLLHQEFFENDILPDLFINLNRN
jgi:aspartate kinase